MKRMKRTVKASEIVTDAERVYELVEKLQDIGVDEHTIFDHFLSYLPSADSLEILKDLMRVCDIDPEEVG